MKLLTHLLGALIIIVAFSSCNKAASNQSGSQGKNKKIQVVYIPKASGIQYFDDIVKGFEHAAQKYDFEFTTIAPAKANATSQLAIVKSQIKRGVDVICISPNSEDALDSVFKRARAKGIKVFTVNNDIANPANRDLAIQPSDVTKIGEIQIEMLGSMIDYKGDFAIISATTDAPDQNAWIAVMKQTLEKNEKYKAMKLVDIVYGDDEPQKSATECNGLLSRYAHLKGIIAPTAAGLPAVAQAIKVKGTNIVVTGLGTPNGMRGHIKDGTATKFALWKPYNEGVMAGFLAVKMIKNNLKITEGTKVEIPEIGTRTFDENRTTIGDSPLIFTKDNIDDFNF
jgi:rhamnose transport system substrate-binding protein